MQKVVKKLLNAEVLPKEIKESTLFSKEKSICNVISGKTLKKYKLLNFTAKKNTGMDRRLLWKASTKSSKLTPRESEFNKNCTLLWGTSTTEMTSQPGYLEKEISRKWKADFKGDFSMISSRTFTWSFLPKTQNKSLHFHPLHGWDLLLSSL